MCLKWCILIREKQALSYGMHVLAMEHTIVDIPQFLCQVLWTDEAEYTRSDVHNLHSLHVWATENPWAGIIGDYVI